MVMCSMIGCSSRSGRDKGTSLYSLPKVRKDRGEREEALLAERRRLWLAAISREELKFENPLLHERVCAKHFIKGMNK